MYLGKRKKKKKKGKKKTKIWSGDTKRRQTGLAGEVERGQVTHEIQDTYVCTSTALKISLSVSLKRQAGAAEVRDMGERISAAAGDRSICAYVRQEPGLAEGGEDGGWRRRSNGVTGLKFHGAFVGSGVLRGRSV